MTTVTVRSRRVARFRWWLALAVLAAGLLPGATTGPELVEAADDPTTLDSGRAAFTVMFDGEVVRYRILAVFVLPGASTDIEVIETSDQYTYRLTAPAGRATRTGDTTWSWRAPAEPGLVPLDLVREQDGRKVRLNVFVLVPRSQVRDGRLNGYRIGTYPDKPLKGLAIYEPPAGFVEVTAGNVDTPVSPHFTLGQFLCKQEGDFPKYLVLKTRLVSKLEYVLQKIDAAGMRADGLVIMSGYRTPWYNRSIGNVQYSRHVWGGAADIYLDRDPCDGQMDDLNADGTVDVQDAAELYEIVDRQFGTEAWEPFVGGLGQYSGNASHGPFVHVDVRGFRARWGD